MKWVVTILVIAVIALGWWSFTLNREVYAIIDDLNEWTGDGPREVSVVTWLHETADVICNVVAANSNPENAYAAETTTYCATGDPPPNDPPPPPPWGFD